MRLRKCVDPMPALISGTNTLNLHIPQPVTVNGIFVRCFLTSTFSPPCNIVPTLPPLNHVLDVTYAHLFSLSFFILFSLLFLLICASRTSFHLPHLSRNHSIRLDSILSHPHPLCITIISIRYLFSSQPFKVVSCSQLWQSSRVPRNKHR